MGEPSSSTVTMATTNTEDPHTLLSQYVQGSNIMQEAKAYFRSKVAIDLINKLPLSNNSGDTDRTETMNSGNPILSQIPVALQHAIVAEHLRSHNLRFTLSVLAAEAPISTHHDNIIHINNLHHRLQPLIPYGSTTVLPSSTSSTSTTEDYTYPSPLGLLLVVLNQYEQSLSKETTINPSLSTIRSGIHPSSVPSSLAEKLNEIENYHKDLVVLQETSSGNIGNNAKMVLNNIRKEMQERYDKELSLAISKIRNEEGNRIRNEERVRYETLLRDTQHKVPPTGNATVSLSSSNEYDTSVSLQAARDEASSMALDIRQRLVNELDTLAVRENQLRKAMALENRAMELEKERHQDEVRRLMVRIRESEDLARNADIKAKIAFEKWKNEFILDIERRETTLTADEQRIKDHLAKAQAAEREATSSISRIPLLLSEIEGLKNEKSTLLLTIERETAAAYGTQLRFDALSKSFQEEQQRVNAANARAEAAEATALRATSNANSTSNDITKQREEWTAAIRMLRNRLAAAAAKVKSQAKKMEELEQNCLTRIETAVSAERKSLEEYQRQWNHERSSLLIELNKHQDTAVKESRKADEAIAQISGYQAKIHELEKIITTLRNDAKASVLLNTGNSYSNSSVPLLSIPLNTINNSNGYGVSSSSSSSSSAHVLSSTHLQRDQLLLSNEHRRFAADSNILKALEALNNSKPLNDPSTGITHNSGAGYSSMYSINPTSSNNNNGTVTPPLGPSSTNTSAILHSHEKLPSSSVNENQGTVAPTVIPYSTSLSYPTTLFTASYDSNTNYSSTVSSVKPPLPPPVSSASSSVSLSIPNDTYSSLGTVVPPAVTIPSESTIPPLNSHTSLIRNTTDAPTVTNDHPSGQPFDVEDSFEVDSHHSSPIAKEENQSKDYTDEDIGYGEEDLY